MADRDANKPSTVRQRIFCYGWSVEKALTKKVEV